jgi:hypothetical protein
MEQATACGRLFFLPADLLLQLTQHRNVVRDDRGHDAVADRQHGDGGCFVARPETSAA